MEIRVTLNGENPDAEPLAMLSGVGLVRGEYIFRQCGLYTTDSKALDTLQTYLIHVCRTFEPRPVWYRVCDFWSDEANVLLGNDIEIEEVNPLLGLRGIRRGLSSPHSLNMEIGAVTEVAHIYSNLHILFPFVQDAEELEQAVKFLDNAHWPNLFGSMIEIPSAVIDVRRIVNTGARNLLIGLNDLSCLMVGRNRSEDFKSHKSIWWAVNYVANNVPSGTEWGIAGRMTKCIFNQLQTSRIPYASVSYSELPKLMGIEEEKLPELGLEQAIKAKTRMMKLQRLIRLRTARPQPLMADTLQAGDID